MLRPALENRENYVETLNVYYLLPSSDSIFILGKRNNKEGREDFTRIAQVDKLC